MKTFLRLFWGDVLCMFGYHDRVPVRVRALAVAEPKAYLIVQRDEWIEPASGVNEFAWWVMRTGPCRRPGLDCPKCGAAAGSPCIVPAARARRRSGGRISACLARQRIAHVPGGRR